MPTRRQNITVAVEPSTLKRAKVLAARQGTSVSRMLAQLIERMVGEDEAYEDAHRRALALLEEGFHLGGRIRTTREQWHER